MCSEVLVTLVGVLVRSALEPLAPKPFALLLAVAMAWTRLLRPAVLAPWTLLVATMAIGRVLVRLMLCRPALMMAIVLSLAGLVGGVVGGAFRVKVAEEMRRVTEVVSGPTVGTGPFPGPLLVDDVCYVGCVGAVG